MCRRIKFVLLAAINVFVFVHGNDNDEDYEEILDVILPLQDIKVLNCWRHICAERIKDPVELDNLCRARDLPFCYCCGHTTDYIEHGHVCRRYCLMEKTVHPNNEKNITLTKSCQVEESYVDPYDANSPDVIFPVTITRTPLEKITCTSPVNGYTRTLKQLFDDIPPRSAPRSTTIKPKITTQTPSKMRTFSVVDFLTSQAPEENFIQPQFENDKKMDHHGFGTEDTNTNKNPVQNPTRVNQPRRKIIKPVEAILRNSPILFPVDNDCPCINYKSCAWSKKLMQDIRLLSKTSVAYKEGRAKIQDNICDRKIRGVTCCDHQENGHLLH